MSKIYDALKRLEWERAAYHAGTQGARAGEGHGSGAWWTGVLVGCVVGFGMGIVAMTATPARWQPDAPAVVHALPLVETPVPPPTPPPAAVDATTPQPVVDAPPPPEATPSAPAADVLPSAPAAVAVEPPSGVAEPEAAAPDPGTYSIQVGTFRDPANAARLAAQLEARAHRVTVEPSTPDGLWVVRIGGYLERSEAEAVRVGLEREGLSGLRVSRRSPRESEDLLPHTHASAED
jgi:cell division septation protein DedD